jgi:2-oxoglutarate dehydrogenase E2 component (dihydrolipoamide succinyltransferase)
MQVEIKVPVLPESVTEGTLGDWHKQVGDSVSVEENIVDLETDKVVLEIVASSAGVIESIAFETGATVKTDDVLGIINTEAAAAAPATGADQAAVAEEASPVQEEVASGEGRASPAVRKLLLEHNLKAEDIKPSGKKGAITKADVERHLQQAPSQAAAPAAPAAAPAAKTPPPAAIPSSGRNDC